MFKLHVYDDENIRIEIDIEDNYESISIEKKTPESTKECINEAVLMYKYLCNRLKNIEMDIN